MKKARMNNSHSRFILSKLKIFGEIVTTNSKIPFVGQSFSILIVLRASGLKGYQLGSLGKSHQNGDYLKQAMRKIVFPQESNLQPLDYRSTALPLELEKTPPHMLNFGYLNPATCLLYDCNNTVSQLRCFLTFAGQSFSILIVLRASGLKANSSEA